MIRRLPPISRCNGKPMRTAEHNLRFVLSTCPICGAYVCVPETEEEASERRALFADDIKKYVQAYDAAMLKRIGGEK